MYGDDKSVADTFNGVNPLENSASFEVYLTEVKAQNKIAQEIEGIDGVRKVNGSRSVAKGLNSFNLLVTYVSATIIILLLLISVFLISTAVASGIRVRRDEISILQYIGATDAFIKMPFWFEGILIGFCGAIVPLVLLSVLYDKMIAFVLEHFSALSEWLTFVSTGKVFRTLIPMSLAVGVGIGLVGSALSVRKHLRRSL